VVSGTPEGPTNIFFVVSGIAKLTNEANNDILLCYITNNAPPPF
jgi:hypothetical protein